MSGGSILIGKSKNFEILLDYSTPSDDKDIRGFSYRKKGDIYAHSLYDYMEQNADTIQMLEEFEAEQEAIEHSQQMRDNVQLATKDEMALGDIYARMVKAENNATIWKQRAIEAETLLFELEEFHEQLVERKQNETKED